jgi:hypothetical protein
MHQLIFSLARQQSLVKSYRLLEDQCSAVGKRKTYELNTWKAQTQVHSEARKSAEEKIKQLKMNLDAA